MTKPEPEIKHVDPGVLRDLDAKYADVLCPIHGVKPKFEVDENGDVVETMCCAALLQIVRELQAKDAAAGDEEPPKGDSGAGST
ncbi:MAG TPA: hypothetical protein VHB21_18140 [Minicystis sp.]|nr:hypothetical protein [Minicystis sp.]